MPVDRNPLDLEPVIASIEEAAANHPSFPGAMQAIERLVDPMIDAMLQTLNDEKQKALLELIKKRRAGLSLSSSTKTEIVGICKQILAFGAAGIGLSIGFSDKFSAAAPQMQKTIVVGGIFYTEIMLVSLIVMILYTMQARFRYPYLYFDKIGNAWPYFYYASISEGTPRWPWHLKSQLVKGGKLYAEDYLHFAHRVVSEDTTGELRAELQQYFLLVSYQGYAHQFSLRLVNTFFYGFAGAFVTLLVLTAWAVIR
jgi:hypothetical protein